MRTDFLSSKVYSDHNVEMKKQNMKAIANMIWIISVDMSIQFFGTHTIKNFSCPNMPIVCCHKGFAHIAIQNYDVLLLDFGSEGMTTIFGINSNYYQSH